MNTIYHELLVGGKPRRVFDAVSLPDQLVHWWPKECQGERRLRGTYRFFFGEPYDWFGEVARLEPNTAFHVKMTKADADWTPTTFGFDLSEQAGQVRIVFFHRDWPEANQHYRIASFCWAMLLRGLKDYVEQGIVVPFEQRA